MEELEKQIMAEWEMLDVVRTLALLNKRLMILEPIENASVRLDFQKAILTAIEKLMPFLDEGQKKEHEEAFTHLIISREQLLRMYQNHQG